MKSILLKVALFGLATTLLVVTGCGSEGLPAGKSPEDVITEALLNGGDNTQTIYDINASADLEGEVDGEQNSLEGNLKMSGSTNTVDSTMLMKLALDANMNNEAVSADFEIRATADGVFVKIGEIAVSDEESQELVQLMLEEYIGKWVELTFMTSEEVVDSGYADVDYDEGDPLPFKNIEYVGTTDILGLNSYHFTADIDEDLILNMIGDAASTADAEEFFKSATIKGDVYVAVNEKVITGFGGTVTLNDPEMNGTVEMQVKVNPTKSEKVSTPTAEVEFTEEDMGALLFGGMVMDPAMMDDSMMMDTEGGMTDEEFEAMMMMMEESEGVPGESVAPGEGLIQLEDVPEMIQ
jgi:hypothetical protein